MPRMTDWRDHLTDAEKAELATIEARKIADRKQARKIFDRARKRMARDAIEQGHHHYRIMACNQADNIAKGG